MRPCTPSARKACTTAATTATPADTGRHTGRRLAVTSYPYPNVDQGRAAV